jgi:LytS/YehU family sensor histidine kinase
MQQIKIFVLLLSVFITLPVKVVAQNLDSLVSALKTATHDTARIKILGILAENCDNADILKYAGPQKALCEKAIAAKLEPAKFYLSNLASAINNTGYYYSKTGEPSKALDNYKLAYEAYEKINDSVNAAYALNNIAFIYNNQGDALTALEYFYKNLKLQEATRDTTGIAYTLNNIAFSFVNQKDYKNASEYFLRSLHMFESHKDKKGIAMVYGNMGTIHTYQGNSSQALEYYKKSLTLYDALHDNFGISSELSSIGSEYAKTGEDSLAVDYFKRALAVAEQAQVKNVQAYALTALARILFKKEDITTAKEYAMRSLQLAQELGNPEDIENAAGLLKEIYVRENNYKDAFDMYALEVKMNDSIVNETNRKDAITKNLQYKYEKKELLSKLDNEKVLEKRNRIVFISLAVAAITALLAFFYIRQNKLKAQLYRMELEQQQYRAQMNPHFIFNCMNSIQHYIVHNDVKQANKFLSQFAGLMRRTLDINTGHFITVEEEMNYLDNYLQLEQMRFDEKFSYKIICADEIGRTQVLLPTMMLQPFAENAIQHGLRYLPDNSGVLIISFQKLGNMLVCTIDDNGIGREAAQQFKKHSGTVHQSQGMSLIESKLSVLNNIYKTSATVTVTDKMDANRKAAGTTVVLKFPLAWK